MWVALLALRKANLLFSLLFVLPCRSARLTSLSKTLRHQPRPRSSLVWRCTRPLFTGFVVFLLLGFYFYEPHIELTFYCRNWVTTQIEPIAPLRGCFDPSSPYQDALYNVSDALWCPRKTEVQSRMSLRMGLDCCDDLAGTIPPPPPYDSSTHKHIPGEKRLGYHAHSI
jgi:hypothetical protein